MTNKAANPNPQGCLSSESDWPARKQELVANLRRVRAEIYQTGKIARADGTLADVWPVGLTRSRGQVLMGLVENERATTCIETGMAYGMSASFLLEACLKSCETEPRKNCALVTSIDPFESRVWGRAGVHHLKSSGTDALHELYETGSELKLPELAAGGRTADIAFVDGDHRFDYVFLDIFYLRRLVGPGRLIIVDDAWMPAVQKACAFFVNANLCSSESSGRSIVEAKFTVLRVESTGDSREWDHFNEF